MIACCNVQQDKIIDFTVGGFWSQVEAYDKLLFPVLLAVQELQANDAYANRWGRIVETMSAQLVKLRYDCQWSIA